MFVRRQLLPILCILFLGGHGVQAGTLESAGTPNMLLPMSAYRIRAPLNFCGEAVPLDNPDVRERMERELLISAWNNPQVILWMKRSGRYMPYIEKMLRENKMPEDLKFVAIAESALRNYAGSSKGAKGVWQFMEETGTKYHLKVDDDFDERRSFFAATRAALNYLKDLYAMFGSWTLAVAAYNMGESGLQSEMLIQRVNNYYQLYLPLETQQYVFRILSAKLILSNPTRYGFHLREEDLYSPHSVEQIEISCSQDTPVQIIAQTAKTDFKVIKDLNPEIRGYYLPAGHHVLFVPRGAAEGFQTRFEGLFSQWLVDGRANVYIVKKGDNLFSLAERFKVPIQAILAWNRRAMKKKLNQGDRLIIFSNALKAPESKDQ
jgi:membrane-bound lytic murein transglycosylase D